MIGALTFIFSITIEKSLLTGVALIGGSCFTTSSLFPCITSAIVFSLPKKRSQRYESSSLTNGQNERNANTIPKIIRKFANVLKATKAQNRFLLSIFGRSGGNRTHCLSVPNRAFYQ